MNNIIELKNLKKVYKDTTTVDLKKLTVREGEIYGFLGPNGAGKTTTMKMILSLVEPTLGEILVNGQNIKENKDYLNQIGSMIEEPSYYPNLKAYSLGMKQRLALAFALVKKPQILLLDEPTNGLDPAGIHEIRELIVKLAKEEGLTVFISSHILSEIEQIADRVGIINHGCLVYEGEIREIKSNTWIEIGGDFSQNNIVQHLVDFGSVRVREASASEVKLDDMSNDRLADIITYITDLGFRIFRVTRESETLEDIFLELTKEV